MYGRRRSYRRRSFRRKSYSYGRRRSYRRSSSGIHRSSTSGAPQRRYTNDKPNPGGAAYADFYNVAAVDISSVVYFQKTLDLFVDQSYPDTFNTEATRATSMCVTPARCTLESTSNTITNLTFFDDWTKYKQLYESYYCTGSRIKIRVKSVAYYTGEPGAPVFTPYTGTTTYPFRLYCFPMRDDNTSDHGHPPLTNTMAADLKTLLEWPYLQISSELAVNRKNVGLTASISYKQLWHRLALMKDVGQTALFPFGSTVASTTFAKRVGMDLTRGNWIWCFGIIWDTAFRGVIGSGTHQNLAVELEFETTNHIKFFDVPFYLQFPSTSAVDDSESDESMANSQPANPPPSTPPVVNALSQLRLASRSAFSQQADTSSSPKLSSNHGRRDGRR